MTWFLTVTQFPYHNDDPVGEYFTTVLYPGPDSPKAVSGISTDLTPELVQLAIDMAKDKAAYYKEKYPNGVFG